MAGGDLNLASKMHLVPELRSKHAAYPMQRSKWLSSDDEAPDGEPAFIPSPPPTKGEEKELREDYVWGPGTRGFGYYHVLTKEAYVALEARLQKESAPDGCGCFGTKKGKDDVNKSDLRDVHHVVYFRSKSPVPNDDSARQHGIKEGNAYFRPQEDLGPWDVKPSKIKG